MTQQSEGLPQLEYDDRKALAERDTTVSGDPVTEKDKPFGTFPAGKPSKVIGRLLDQEEYQAFRAAVEMEYAITVIATDAAAVERMAATLAKRAYLPPPFDAHAIVRDLLEAAKVPEDARS